MALGSRSRYMHLVINDFYVNDKILYLKGERLNNLCAYLSTICDFYALIYHDLDTKLDENGLAILKTPHTHIVGLVKPTGYNSKTGDPIYPRVSTIFNGIEMATGFSTTTMSTRENMYWIYSCRYLLHLDHPDKFAYDRKNVVTSDDTTYDYYISQEPETKTGGYLFNLLVKCDYSLYAIINAMGIDEYKKYRLVIQDICKATFKTLQR